jgi:hypothetical protein
MRQLTKNFKALFSADNPNNINNYCENCVFNCKRCGFWILVICYACFVLFLCNRLVLPTMKDNSQTELSKQFGATLLGVIWVTVFSTVLFFLTMLVYAILRLLFMSSYLVKLINRCISFFDYDSKGEFHDYYLCITQTIIMTPYYAICYLLGVVIAYKSCLIFNFDECYDISFLLGIFTMSLIPICGIILIVLIKCIIIISDHIRFLYRAYNSAGIYVIDRETK